MTTSPEASITSTRPAEAIWNVLSCDPYSSAFCAISPTLGTLPMVAGIQRPMRFAKVNRGLIHACVRAVWNDGHGVLGLALCIPHLAALTNHGWHGSVDDHVRRDMQVGDAFV